MPETRGKRASGDFSVGLYQLIVPYTPQLVNPKNRFIYYR
jgi:hypothetical protein